jgi:hypothetical protein
VLIDAPWTAIRDTPNKSLRLAAPRLGVVLHHAAMTSLDVLRHLEVDGAKQVSSTAICKDDQLEVIVPDDRYRPWSLANAYGDSAYRSIETCNESTTGWTISDASHESLARAVAYWAERDGFWPHRDGDSKGWTVRGHREMAELGLSYPTACPGGLDLDRVTRRAQQLLTPPPPTPTDPGLIRRQKGPTMYLRSAAGDTYNVFTDANGKPRLRVCGRAEASFALLGGLVVEGGDNATLTLLAEEAGYKFRQPLELPQVKVAP